MVLKNSGEKAEVEVVVVLMGYLLRLTLARRYRCSWQRIRSGWDPIVDEFGIYLSILLDLSFEFVCLSACFDLAIAIK